MKNATSTIYEMNTSKNIIKTQTLLKNTNKYETMKRQANRQTMIYPTHTHASKVFSVSTPNRETYRGNEVANKMNQQHKRTRNKANLRQRLLQQPQ